MSSQNNKNFRWFLESANVFSPYIVIQLIASMIALSADVFGLDMVTLFDE